mgnify:CR=1 FL=1
MFLNEDWAKMERFLRSCVAANILRSGAELPELVATGERKGRSPVKEYVTFEEAQEDNYKLVGLAVS